MKSRIVFAALAVLAASVIVATPPAEAAGPTVKFGIGEDGTDAMKNAGVAPNYVQTWVGRWMKTYGWGGLDGAISHAKARGLTLVVEWYYWGDSISVNCVKYGCDGRSVSEWYSMTDTLASKLGASGVSAIVVVESEFNKNGIADSYAYTFDGMLRTVEDKIHAKAPNAKTAIGFGNWGRESWTKFTRAVSGADYVGFQAMAASTRQTSTEYLAVDDAIESTTKHMRSVWPTKPVLLHDLALASYSGSTWEGHQREFMTQLFQRMGALAASGLEGIVWRYYKDNDLSSGYFGPAESYWGLAHRDGSPKPAWWTWVNGIKSHRAGGEATSTVAPAPVPTSGFTATFTPSNNGNNYWVETGVSSAHSIASVCASVNGGTCVPLAKKSWGAWAKSFYVPTGAGVTFKATSSGGATASSATYAWPIGSAPSTSTASSTFSATFTPSKNGNNYWVETGVSSSQEISAVCASVNGGTCVPLAKKSWGAWAASFYVPTGAGVKFKATSTSGAIATSATYAWPYR